MMLRTDQREDATAVGRTGSEIQGDKFFGVRVADTKLEINGLLRRDEAGVRTLLSWNIEAELNVAQ